MILNEKVIIVTGGSGLIGSEIVKDIKLEGGIAINFDYIDGYDITNVDSIQQFIKDKNITAVDGVVNNAYPRTKHWGNDIENEIEGVFDENVKLQLGGLHTFTKQFLPYLKQSKGSVVNIASIYGMVGNDFSMYESTSISSPAGYCAIKGATINLTRYMASYYGKQNINFNCVSPGGILDNQDKMFIQNYNDKCPMGRMGNPDDIAPTVSFLLSNKAKYITGQNIAVDGGWTSI
jgi:NAD(P)-dependent dehydrogenase (short-subunit alcohol dehydrogenase family)